MNQFGASAFYDRISNELECECDKKWHDRMICQDTKNMRHHNVYCVLLLSPNHLIIGQLTNRSAKKSTSTNSARLVRLKVSSCVLSALCAIIALLLTANGVRLSSKHQWFVSTGAMASIVLL